MNYGGKSTYKDAHSFLAEFDKQGQIPLTEEGTTPNFIHIGGNDQNCISLIRRALSNVDAKNATLRLAESGYFAYYGNEDETRFVNRSRIPSLWGSISDGSVSVSENGVFYRAEPSTLPAKSLLVVFSGMAPDSTHPTLWRYFTKNYQHLRSLIPPHTEILRVADFGGVNGAFYRDTIDRPENKQTISSFIRDYAARLDIPESQICLLGSSKGATAAFMYGLEFNWNFVAVDPVLEDTHYELKQNDAHFTQGNVFFKSKQSEVSELISRLDFEELELNPRARVLFTAPKSAQFKTVCTTASLVGAANPRLVVSSDPTIEKHPQVAGKLLWATLHQVVEILMGMNYKPGIQSL